MKPILRYLSHYDWGAFVGTILFGLFYLGIISPVIVNAPVIFFGTQQKIEYPGKENPSENQQASLSQSSDDAIARYTLWLALFTAVLAVSTIGLWRVTEKTLSHAQEQAWRQASDMRASISAANVSADAALRALDHNRESSARQLRAYVSSAGTESNPSIQRGLMGADYVEGFVFRSHWKNAGQTPANNVIISIFHQHFPMNENRQSHFGREAFMSDDVGMVLGPGMEAASYFLLIPIDILRGVWMREMEVFVWTRCEYRDALDPNIVRHSEITHRLDFLRDPAELPVPNSRNIPPAVLMAWGPQNSSS